MKRGAYVVIIFDARRRAALLAKEAKRLCQLKVLSLGLAALWGSGYVGTVRGQRYLKTDIDYHWLPVAS